MAEHILRTGFYSKSEASAWALPLGISQGTIDGWFSTAVAEGPGKHAMRQKTVGGEIHLSGAELMQRAMKALGQSWVMGQ